MRLFAALPLPEAAVERLTKFRLRTSTPKDGLRWSTPEQWHITLQFYGELDEERAGCVERHMAVARHDAPVMTLEGLGLFAAKGILFASIEATPSLLSLQAGVEQNSAKCGISAESRPFRPHITLARSKGKVGTRSLQVLSTPALPSLGPDLRWHATEMLLLESILRPQGAEYLVRSRIELSMPA